MAITSFNIKRISDIYTDTQALLTRLTAARALYLDNLDNANLLLIPDISTLTTTRISNLDNLDAAVSAAVPEYYKRVIERPREESATTWTSEGNQTIQDGMTKLFSNTISITDLS